MASINLYKLKQSLHEDDSLDIITQCEIVGEAMAPWAPYMENYEGLALFLEISDNKVYQMNYIHHNLLPSLKEWFRESKYKCHTTFMVSRLSPEKQEEWLRDAEKRQQSFSL